MGENSDIYNEILVITLPALMIYRELSPFCIVYLFFTRFPLLSYFIVQLSKSLSLTNEVWWMYRTAVWESSLEDFWNTMVSGKELVTMFIWLHLYFHARSLLLTLSKSASNVFYYFILLEKLDFVYIK